MNTSIGQGWNFFRVLRLILGIVIIVQALMAADLLLGILGILFSSMALFNIGCCTAGGCSMPVQKKKLEQKEIDIQYEEVSGRP